MDYMMKRDVQRVLKGTNSEIQWTKREIRRVATVPEQASLQRYRYLLGLQARKCHLTLAHLNGTPYERSERVSRKAVPELMLPQTKTVTSTPQEYSFSLFG